MFNLDKEIDRLRRKRPNVRAGRDWTPHYIRRAEAEMGLPRYGIVADNKDPKCIVFCNIHLRYWIVVQFVVRQRIAQPKTFLSVYYRTLGRVRVAADTIAPGLVTPWIPVIAIGARNNTGWWQLPDIGSQVLMAFVGKGHNNPVIIGCLYDLKHLPPKHSTKRRYYAKMA